MGLEPSGDLHASRKLGSSMRLCAEAAKADRLFSMARLSYICVFRRDHGPRKTDPNPSVRVRVTEEPSPRSGRSKVAHGASRGNAAPSNQGAPAGARENGSSPPCSVRPRFNHGRSGTHRVMRITGPPGLSETSRFSFSSSRQAATGKRLKHPCRGWKSFGHTYPRLAPWATFKRPLRGLGSSVADKLTDGLATEVWLLWRRNRAGRHTDPT